MGQHHGGGPGVQGGFHHPADGNARRVYAALTDFPAAQDLAFRVQAQQKHRFHLAPEEKGEHEFRAAFQSGEDLLLERSVHQIKPARFRNEVQKGCGVVAYAGHLPQLLHRRFQHLGQRTEPVKQRVGKRVGVLLGDAVEQQQLQCLDLGKAVQTFFKEAFFHPFSVTVMDGHCVHLRRDWLS